METPHVSYNSQIIFNKYEDQINLLTDIAQQPVETITDFETTTKLVFSALSQLIEKKFCDNFLKLLHNLKDHAHITLSAHSEPDVKIHIRDKFVFKVLLLVSLKYKRSIFIASETPKSFIQVILQEITEIMNIVKPQSLHLLRLIDVILKKRDDVLTPELSLLILKSMNKAAYSPLTGFKNWAQNVSRILLRSLSDNTKKNLCNFNNLPIKGIDLNDILKLCDEKDIHIFTPLLNKQILKFFCNNTDSREGSFFYHTLTNFYNFDEFIEKIWPYYIEHFQRFDEGEFYQSFLKYWIPITVKQYENKFYVFIQTDNKINCFLKAYTLLETRKRGFYDESFNSDSLQFLKHCKTSDIALKIICTYVKKHTYPSEFEIQAVQFFLNHYSQFEFSADVLKALKQFISQIFLVCHMSLSKSDDANVNSFSDFLNFIYRVCTKIFDGENFEVGAQLLEIVWDIAAGSSVNLTTGFKIDRENEYKIGGNLFYVKLKNNDFWDKTFCSEFLINLMQDIFIEKFKYCPKLLSVVTKRYLELITLKNFTNLTTLLFEIRNCVCLQSSEKIRAYTNLIISYQKLKNQNFSDDITELCKNFDENIDIFDPQCMFTCVLILDVLITAMNYEEINVTALLKKSLIFFDKIFEENLGATLNTKDTKVLESLINNVIECLTASKTFWSEFKTEELLNNFCKIIQVSNMKRPVSLAANFIIYYGKSIDDEVKLQLLDRTLNSLYHNKQSGKIRRNPETRLVIHALCLADKNQNKPFLISSLNFMLEVLLNPLSSDFTLSSTLNSLEVLVSDNSIHVFTLPFIVDIVQNCVRLFNKPSWIVRNADLQLLKSLIERLLGVSLDENIRPKSIEDVFTLFPALIPYFYEILSSPELDDSAIMVLLFFSESQIKNDMFVQEILENDFEKFRHLFIHIIKDPSNKVGFLAIKAFTSLCPNPKIPDIFSEIVDYIQRNFLEIDKNVFANFIKLLQRLHQKYKLSLDRTREDIITSAISVLKNYLKPFDCFYFNLLSLRLYSACDISDKIVSSLSHEIDYKTRIWLNNYIPYVIAEIEFIHLENVLKRMFECHLPEFLQIRILEILVDRSNDMNFPANGLIEILISKLTTLSNVSPFLSMTYSRSILLFNKRTSDLNISSDVINKIRQDCQTDCIHKIFIYVFALANCDCKCENDNTFLTKFVEKYIENIDDDNVEIMTDISSTVQFLYKVVAIKDRYNVLKLVFYLLMNDYTSFEMCSFISWLSQSDCNSVLNSAVNLLNFSRLCNCVGSKKLASSLLSEFYRFVEDLPDDLEESDTYYLIEKDRPLSKQCVKNIIRQSLDECVDEASCT